MSVLLGGHSAHNSTSSLRLSQLSRWLEVDSLLPLLSSQTPYSQLLSSQESLCGSDTFQFNIWLWLRAGEGGRTTSATENNRGWLHGMSNPHLMSILMKWLNKD